MRRIGNGLGSRLNYANVVATIALFCAIGGGTFAFAALKKNSVGTKQIAKNAVTNAKIAAGAVTDQKLGAVTIGAGELLDGSVGTGKLADNAVTGPKLTDGAVTGEKVNESTLGEVPLAAAAAKASNVLFVSVNSDGTIASQGQPGTNVSKVPLILGRYSVTFGRNLSNCSAAATVGFNGEGSVVPNDAVAGASIETVGQNSVVSIQTRDLAGAEEDNNFHLIVTC